VTRNIINEIIKSAARCKVDGKATVIAINGVDTAGKTSMAKQIAKQYHQSRQDAVVIHLDDFHRPKKQRYAGSNDADNYFYRSFNYPLLLERILVPLHDHQVVDVTLPILDPVTDQYDREKSYLIEAHTIVILEGVFLFREELANYLDLKVFLQIEFDEVIRRALVRDVNILADRVIERYRNKYLPAQQIYMELCSPAEQADLLIDNTDWRNPCALSTDY